MRLSRHMREADAVFLAIQQVLGGRLFNAEMTRRRRHEYPLAAAAGKVFCRMLREIACRVKD